MADAGLNTPPPRGRGGMNPPTAPPPRAGRAPPRHRQYYYGRGGPPPRPGGPPPGRGPAAGQPPLRAQAWAASYHGPAIRPAGRGRGQAGGGGARPPPPPPPLVHHFQPDAAQNEVFLSLMAGPEGGVGPLAVFEQRLADHWTRSDQPHRALLAFLTRCPDFKRGKTGPHELSAKLFTAFTKWRPAPSSSQAFDELTPEFQWQACEQFVHARHLHHFAMVVRLISPLKVESARLASLVQVEVDRRNYSRAAAIATTLGVQTAFEFCDICVPCLLENAIERVEDYVEPHPELQIQLVQFLDGITTNNAAQLSALWRSYPWIQTKSPRLSGKSLGKLIERLLKKFELDPKMAPLHTKTRTFLAFRYQVLTKNEPTTRLENWRDLVGEFVGKDLELAYTLVNLLTNGRSIDPDFKEAQFWANKLDLDRRRLPYGIDDDFEDPLSGNGDDADENWDEDQNGGKFYALRLPRERILMIDTQPAFRDFLAVLAEETVSGYDSETLPMTSDGVALMQVAFPDQVFLLDANALSGKLSHEDWTGFVQGYFNNPNLLKLGFGLAPDLKNMERFHPAFANLRQTAKRVLDLDPLHRQLFLASNQVLIASYTSDNRGLSGFVESIFGLPLDKRDQISHWDKRPLSESQTIYAALDAFVLLDLYNQILALSEVRGQKDHVLKVIETTIKFGNKLEKNEKKLNSAEEKAMRKEMANLRLSQPVQPLNKEPISVRDIRIACDGMLQGLCKKLRLHGIDTRTIENFESTERLGEIAQEEKRMILTRGVKSFVKLKKFVPPGFILIIQDDLLDHQVEEVLHYFNIRMSPDDFFSRCVLCNGSDYLTIPSSILKEIKENISKVQSSLVFNAVPPEEYESTDSYYDGFRDDFNEDDDDDANDFVPRIEAEHVQWVKLEDGKLINGQNGQTASGVPLKIGDVMDEVIQAQDTFYACSQCGKLFWKGSHWDKVLNKRTR